MVKLMGPNIRNAAAFLNAFRGRCRALEDTKTEGWMKSLSTETRPTFEEDPV
jgi:hypothetical protein